MPKISWGRLWAISAPRGRRTRATARSTAQRSTLSFWTRCAASTSAPRSSWTSSCPSASTWPTRSLSLLRFPVFVSPKLSACGALQRNWRSPPARDDPPRHSGLGGAHDGHSDRELRRQVALLAVAAPSHGHSRAPGSRRLCCQGSSPGKRKNYRILINHFSFM